MCSTGCAARHARKKERKKDLRPLPLERRKDLRPLPLERKKDLRPLQARATAQPGTTQPGPRQAPHSHPQQPPAFCLATVAIKPAKQRLSQAVFLTKAVNQPQSRAHLSKNLATRRPAHLSRELGPHSQRPCHGCPASARQGSTTMLLPPQ
jgi:hypothetical protein